MPGECTSHLHWCIPQCGLAPYYNKFKCLANQIDCAVYDIKTEVTDSRGCCCTLDDRLDVSINEDGTLKAGLAVNIYEKGCLKVTNPSVLDYCNGLRVTDAGGGAAAFDLAIDTLTYFPLTPFNGQVVYRTDICQAYTYYACATSWREFGKDTYWNRCIGSYITPKYSSEDLYMSGQTAVRLGDSGSNYVGLKAPTTVSSNLIWTMPAADGSTSQFLCTDGSGTLGWGTAGGGGWSRNCDNCRLSPSCSDDYVYVCTESGSCMAIQGRSNNIGVLGIGSPGVKGASYCEYGVGVHGDAQLDYGCGVVGDSYGANGIGVIGRGYGTGGIGVIGCGCAGGVKGYTSVNCAGWFCAGNDYGIASCTRRNIGGYFRVGIDGCADCRGNFGVVGIAANAAHVLPAVTCSGCYGVYGYAFTNYGVYGYACNYGTVGFACRDYGVYGCAGNDYGVVGCACGHVGVAGVASCVAHTLPSPMCYGEYGVYGYAQLSYGVYGLVGDGFCYGVYGEVRTTGNYAVYGKVGCTACTGLGTNGTADACYYKVNGTPGAGGGTFTTITSITVCNGLITAITGS